LKNPSKKDKSTGCPQVNRFSSTAFHTPKMLFTIPQILPQPGVEEKEAKNGIKQRKNLLSTN